MLLSCPQQVGPLYYYIKYTAAPGADFASCGGLAYPGSLIGWGPTWNAHGIFHTVNTLLPRRIRPSGISTSFIQRDAICGFRRGDTVDEVLDGLARTRWSDGASINVVGTTPTTAGIGNIETHEDQHSTVRLSDLMGNDSHCNAYKRLPVD